jgi:hypothetical protein
MERLEREHCQVQVPEIPQPKTDPVQWTVGDSHLRTFGAQTPFLKERRSSVLELRLPFGHASFIALGECDWPKGATDNVRSLRRRGSVFEQEQEKTECSGLTTSR